MSQPRILFVDDDRKILDGLRRMLRRQRHVWNLDFATSGTEALRLMEQAPFDVVVTDMRMPEMDGAELLSQVADRFPETMRFVLSGYSERESTMRAAECAHQFLSKPCEASVLQGALTRSLCLKERLSSELLRRVVSHIDSLPSLPELYQEIQRIANSDEAGLNDASQIVAKDISMSAKLLQLVNSSFFSLPHVISSVQQAVSLLGIETLKSLVLVTGVFKSMPLGYQPNGFSEKRFWQHCTRCGALAKNIVLQETGDKVMAEHAMSAGLLHDLGKLVLATELPEAFRDTLEEARKCETTFNAIELECEGVSHADIGAYLLDLWRLPLPVVDAVAFHHAPEQSGCDSFNTTVAVYAANILVQEGASDTSGNGIVPEFDLEFLSRLGLVERIECWRGIELAEVETI